MEQDLKIVNQFKEKLVSMLPATMQDKCKNFDEMFDIYFPNYADEKLFGDGAYISVTLVGEKFQIDGMPICKIRLHEKFKTLSRKEQLLTLFQSVLQGFQMHQAQSEVCQ
jgi:hypothetical protein